MMWKVQSCSKKRLDAVKNWAFIEKAREEKPFLREPLRKKQGRSRCYGKGNKGVYSRIPERLKRSRPVSAFEYQTAVSRHEVSRSKRRVVGSIRDVKYEMRKPPRRKPGMRSRSARDVGTVKSLTSYGAFIDIGGGRYGPYNRVELETH